MKFSTVRPLADPEKAARATLLIRRPDARRCVPTTPGQPNRSGVEGRRFDRIDHNRPSWQKPARARPVRLMADGWQREFDEPIETPEGTELRTLREAIAYLAKTVPKSERDMPAVTTAPEMLTSAASARSPGCSWRGSAS
jgi:hypothetical protein